MKDRYVLDSSIWISLERGEKKVKQLVEPLIQKNQVCLVDVIEAEVLRGAVSQKDYNTLKEAFSYFEKLTTNWNSVAEIAFLMGRKGYMPPLIDVYIANAVMENKKTLVTHDKHFLHIEKILKIKLLML